MYICAKIGFMTDIQVLSEQIVMFSETERLRILHFNMDRSPYHWNATVDIFYPEHGLWFASRSAVEETRIEAIDVVLYGEIPP